MSLIVWLPLNGNLENQGLSNVTVTNNGATVDNNGKIGKCYSFGSSKRITVSQPANLSTTAASLSCWVNLSAWGSSYDSLVNLSTGTGWNDTRLAFVRNDTANRIGFCVANGSTYNFTVMTSDLPLNTWTHLTGTFDGSTIKIYVNGVLNNSAATTFNSLVYSSAVLNLGSWSNGNNYPITGKLNDVRVYSHCLSAKEVKDLAKGLVLHYRLAGPGHENIIEHSHNSNGWSIGSGWTSFTDGDGTKGYRFTRTGATANNWVRIIPPTKINPNDYPEGITVSIDIKTPNISAINNTCIGALQIYDSTGARSGWYEPNWDLSKVKNNIWTKISYFFTQEALRTVQQSGMTYNYTMFSFQLVQNGDISIKNFKAERGNVRTPWCPNPTDALYTAMGYSTGVEYDCSGYKHNGIPVSATTRPTWDIDSPRYTTSFNYSGNPNQANYTTSTDMNFIDNFSWAIWVKPNYTAGNAQYVFTGGRADTGGYGYGLQVTSTTSCTIYYGSNGRYAVNVKSGEWHHIAFTKSGTTCKCYLDGSLVSMNTFSGTNPTYSDGNGVGIGCFHYSGNIYPYFGKASDLRIYATTLSDTDITELYHSAVIVDNTGKSYAYEYFEV